MSQRAIHHQIQVAPGASLRIAGDIYRFTGVKQWAIATRALALPGLAGGEGVGLKGCQWNLKN